MINSPNMTRPAKQAWSRRRALQPDRARKCTLIPRYSSVSPACKLINTQYRRLSFKVPLHVSYGETVFVVGLTSWEASSAQPLQWTEGDVWTGEFKVAVQEAPIEFKLLKQSNGNFDCGQETLSHIVWQPGVNLSIIISEDIVWQPGVNLSIIIPEDIVWQPGVNLSIIIPEDIVWQPGVNLSIIIPEDIVWQPGVNLSIIIPEDIVWQPGVNLSIIIPEDIEAVDVTCSWGGSIQVLPSKAALDEEEDRHHTPAALSENAQQWFVVTSSPVKLLSNIVSAGALLQAVEMMKDTVWATTGVHTNKVVHTVDTTSGPQRLFPATSKDEKAHDYKAVNATKTEDVHLIPDHMVIMPNLECEGRGLAMRKDGGVDSTGHDMNTAAGLCVVEELTVMSKGTAMMLTHGFNSAIMSLALRPLPVVLPPIGWASNLTTSLQASLVKMWRKCVALLLLALWRSRFI
ncbi:hypothetical protein CEUSTIGMA_g11475.t1 [Chlamydomonas eustigma]|uniref:CBM20 domain-containing protein n=1 Tax=Chlamydomonas eustigma TaxID=1157962 RepID=A0A250XLS9_9CHLO|nr:hypothetical protein CEUSTIGMA_g11475.t1 [Chlamydomonas eustigma]|eukprot:GAX84051.1 hypothetical protein CEUSTIGMA_g11475.t1 [Chlamydomonas eustigma]